MYAGALRASFSHAARALPRLHSPLTQPMAVARSYQETSRVAWRSFGAKVDPSDVLPEVKEGTAGEVSSIFDQATGLERAEIDHPDLFKHNEVLRGDFGTEDNPVMIQSAFDSRIVGCTGRAAPEDHELSWLVVEKGSKSYCSECGQVFMLDPL